MAEESYCLGPTANGPVASIDVKQFRKEDIVRLAGEAQHEGAARSFQSHNAIIQQLFHRIARGARSDTQEGRDIAALHLTSQQKDAQQVAGPFTQIIYDGILNRAGFAGGSYS
ncbi:hypothetical protein [uncultured Paracoccus sp.]|uniref:hypothetical protein n=1 Tax=uncultured Paracoccus sp. TaxID=189685 RepID=UPI00263845A2|nr:hypothetical protein [uncultured Paracoccus sp.]